VTEWVFGIDGGGTSARLRAEDLQGGLLFFCEGGSTNLESNPRASVAGVLEDLVSRALASGLPADGCRAGYAGSAGVDRSADIEPFRELLRTSSGLSCPLGVGNDSEPALVGALGDLEGIVLVAGTGSVALGRARDGSSARAGGLGHLLGDEGSAWRIAFDALARGLRSLEGRDLPTGLIEAALTHFILSEPLDILPFVHHGLDKTSIARFARVVGEYRDRGDVLALDLFDRAAAELCALVVSVHRRIATKLGQHRLAFRGGLIESDMRLRSDLVARLALSLPDLVIVQARHDAATGACMLARELAIGARVFH
jgi:N-acetylglucosamine kinase-like BadF-type ATPase